MSIVAEARLPGVTFEATPPTLPDVLPRMDVAAFVGYAAAGPPDIPVAVEDAAEFRDVFGDDVDIAREEDTGAVHHSQLGPAVEAFFRNGGRRCRVVRVNGRDAEATRFEMPNVIAVDGDLSPEGWTLAIARARAAGSWADRLRTGTAIFATSLRAHALGKSTVTLTADADVRSGDLLRLTFGEHHTAFVRVAAVEADGPRLAASWDGSTGGSWWFSADPPTSLEARPVTLHRLTTAGQHGVAIVDVHHPWDAIESFGEEQAGDHMIAVDTAEPLVHGDVLRMTFEPVGPSGTPDHLILTVLGPAALGDVPDTSLPTANGAAVWFRARPSGFVLDARPDELDLSAISDTILVVERLEFELLVWQGDGLVARLAGLGFGPDDAGRRRHWAGLPDDIELYARLGNLPADTDPDDRQASGVPSGETLPGLWTEVRAPRFPLAGPADRKPVCLPIGMALASSRLRARGAVSDVRPATRPARNGLERHDANHFLDPDLATATATRLLQRAFHLQYAARRRRPLRGIHSLLPVDEVTLIAVPDAIHPGWKTTTPERPDPLAAPELGPPFAVVDVDQICWTAIDSADGYELERSTDPTFAKLVQRSRHTEGAELSGSFLDSPLPPACSLPGEVFVATLGQVGGCRSDRYLRVRARRGGDTGPWSNTVRVVLPLSAFADCAEPPQPSVLTATDMGDSYRLTWMGPPDGASIEVQSSTDAAFAGHALRRVTEQTHYDVADPVDRPSFHRVRVPRTTDGGTVTPGAWSNTETCPAEPVDRSIMTPPMANTKWDDLSAVHLATLRMCAARGDLFAVLSLPASYREREACAHAASLRAFEFEPRRADEDDTRAAFAMDVTRLGAGEERALTYGVLYHPWPTVRRPGPEGATIEAQPPDGSVTGMIAKRTLARGAWIAPANQPIDGALALDPPLGDLAVRQLLAGRVNPLRSDPYGFLIVGSETLSREESLREISVRRLMILLRRIVIRDGATYVFNPNDDNFRALVRTRLDRTLLDMFHRGAFAGVKPSDAFRITADESVNPPSSVDRGRFVVEIAVAPSQPMKFIAVRLIQTGPGAIALEEV